MPPKTTKSYASHEQAVKEAAKKAKAAPKAKPKTTSKTETTTVVTTTTTTTETTAKGTVASKAKAPAKSTAKAPAKTAKAKAESNPKTESSGQTAAKAVTKPKTAGIKKTPPAKPATSKTGATAIKSKPTLKSSPADTPAQAGGQAKKGTCNCTCPCVGCGKVRQLPKTATALARQVLIKYERSILGQKAFLMNELETRDFDTIQEHAAFKARADGLDWPLQICRAALASYTQLKLKLSFDMNEHEVFIACRDAISRHGPMLMEMDRSRGALMQAAVHHTTAYDLGSGDGGYSQSPENNDSDEQMDYGRAMDTDEEDMDGDLDDYDSFPDQDSDIYADFFEQY